MRGEYHSLLSPETAKAFKKIFETLSARRFRGLGGIVPCSAVGSRLAEDSVMKWDGYHHFYLAEGSSNSKSPTLADSDVKERINVRDL